MKLDKLSGPKSFSVKIKLNEARGAVMYAMLSLKKNVRRRKEEEQGVNTEDRREKRCIFFWNNDRGFMQLMQV